MITVLKIIGIILGSILGLIVLGFIGIIVYNLVDPAGAARLAEKLEKKTEQLKRQAEELEQQKKNKGDK